MVNEVEDDIAEIPAFFDVPVIHQGHRHGTEAIQGIVADSLQKLAPRDMPLVERPVLFHGLERVVEGFPYEVVGSLPEPIVLLMNLLDHFWKILVAHEGFS